MAGGDSKHTPSLRRGLTNLVRSGGRQDFTYKSVSGISLSDADFRQSLFTGAVLENCQFKNVSFDRCDFAGTKIVKCRFENCSFVPAELRSCFVSSTHFVGCDFSGTQWDRTQVKQGIFVSCNFSEASLREASLTNCDFDSCEFQAASITLNQFTHCSFARTDFADCTALFLTFCGCEFNATRFNAESVGFTYGLSDKNVRDLEFIYLGLETERPLSADVIDALIDTYSMRRWYVGMAVLQLNFRRRAPLNAILDVVSWIEAELARTGSVDWDELQFFTTVVRRLFSEDRLPFFGSYLLARVLRAAQRELETEFPSSAGAPAPSLVLHNVDDLIDQQLDLIATIFGLLEFDDIDLVVTWRLTERPELELDRLVLWGTFKSLGSLRVDLLKAATGSWIEAWHLSLDALVAVQLSLVSMNGVTHQLVKLCAETKKLGTLLPWSRKKKTKKPGATRNRHSTNNYLATRRATSAVANAKFDVLTPERIALLESLLSVVAQLSPEERELFLAYDDSHTREIRVAALSGHRAQTRRSNESAKRANPPRPASSKRKRLTRKAKP